MDISASSDSIKANVPNRYSLVVLAAKRAKMIREGSPVLINTPSTNYLTIALEEIAAGKVNYIDAPEIPDDEVPHNAAHEATLAAGARHSAATQMLDESLSAASEDVAEDDGESISDELAETEETDVTDESDSVEDAENE